MNRIVKNQIKQQMLLEEYKYIIEGFDIDYVNKTVSFDPDREIQGNTPALLHPICTETDEYQIISMFRSGKASEYSHLGNPLTHALNNAAGWKFKNSLEDISTMLNQFIQMTGKIKTHYDTIITYPQLNELHVHFLYALKRFITSTHQIEEWLTERDTEHVYEGIINWSGLHDDFPDQDEKLQREINEYFTEMDKNNNGMFSFRYVKNKILHKYFTQMEGFFFPFYSAPALELASLINDMDVLILDGTITHDEVMPFYSNKLMNMYVPKSATIITLFEPTSKSA